MRGCGATRAAPPTSRRPAPAAARLAIASELLNDPQVLPRLRPARRRAAPALGRVELRQRGAGRRRRSRPARRRAPSCSASQSRPPSPRTTSTRRPCQSRRAQLLPQRLGIELTRRPPARRAQLRGTPGLAQRRRGARPGASRPAACAGQAAPRRPRGMKCCTALALTNITSAQLRQARARRAAAAAGRRRRDVDQRQGHGVDAARRAARATQGSAWARGRVTMTRMALAATAAQAGSGGGAEVGLRRRRRAAAPRRARPAPRPRHRWPRARAAACAAAAAPAPAHGPARRRCAAPRLPTRHARPAACCSCRRARATRRARRAPPARSGRCASAASVRASAAASARISMPSAPWPAAGSHLRGVEQRRGCARARPSRFRPAAASTMASYWPSSSLRSRVSRLPRSGSMRRSGRSAQQLHHAAQAGGADHARPAAARASVAKRGARRRHRAGPRAPAPRPARSRRAAPSARPSANAPPGGRGRPRARVSSSLTNRPLPPTLDSARSRIWSPRVVMPSSSTRRPKRALQQRRAHVRPATGRGGFRGWR